MDVGLTRCVLNDGDGYSFFDFCDLRQVSKCPLSTGSLM